VIIPKAIRERLGLRAGDLFEVDIRGSELVLRPRLLRGLRLSGQPAAEATDFLGLVRLGGDSVRDKARLYEPEDSA
jgi:AbrB family looped-hinge helix DNA binding protein